MRSRSRLAALAACLCALRLSSAAGDPEASDERRREVEADWALQGSVRGRPVDRPVTTAEDATGGSDGVADGRWGFHTAEEEAPWWQVDLGEPRAIERVVVYNRTDCCTERASRLAILLSLDGRSWREAYRHDGAVFLGAPDGKPLAAALGGTVASGGAAARFVRVQLPGRTFLHLDEVEVHGAGGAGNIALGRPCDQSSVSQWSSRKPRSKTARPESPSAGELEARWATRREALASPLLDFDAVLFLKRVPGHYSHMSDQNYGWWSRPGGGVCVLEGFRSDEPRVRCLTGAFPPGSFLGLDLSHDARRILFAYARHHPHVAGVRNKVEKDKLPEDAFYHVFEMSADGTGLRQLTRGRYDDFDARYLPDGEIAFLSTRRGAKFQCAAAKASPTLWETLTDSYVRCGGGSYRPVAVYTLHRMGPGGEGIRAILS